MNNPSDSISNMMLFCALLASHHSKTTFKQFAEIVPLSTDGRQLAELFKKRARNSEGHRDGLLNTPVTEP